MPILFEGDSFSRVMNANLKSMEVVIDKLPCAEVLGKSDDFLLSMAKRFAKEYAADDIPRLDRTKIEKLAEQHTKKFVWKVPIWGNASYFNWGPSSYTMYQEVESVDKKYLTINVNAHRFSSHDLAEADTNKRLDEIDKTLEQFRKDAETHFSEARITEAAMKLLKRKRESCDALNQPGYKIV